MKKLKALKDKSVSRQKPERSEEEQAASLVWLITLTLGGFLFTLPFFSLYGQDDPALDTLGIFLQMFGVLIVLFGIAWAHLVERYSEISEEDYETKFRGLILLLIIGMFVCFIIFIVSLINLPDSTISLKEVLRLARF